MRIKYTIYWFEDNNGWLNDSSVVLGILDISKYLENLGFQLDITFFVEQDLSNTRDFRLKKLLDDYPEKYKIQRLDNYQDSNLRKIDFFNVDLVLMDFYLGSEKGNKVIDYIRNDQNDIYTDILFYSQNKNERELREESDKDGLYCSKRSELFSSDKIRKVIKTTIKKTQELNNLRGLVMAETSELDEMIKEILKLLVKKDKVKEEKIVEIKQEIIIFYKAYMEGNSERKIKGIEQYDLPSDFFELLDSRHLTAYSSMKTLKSFSVCEKNSLIKKDIKLYSKVQQERNNLAHSVEDYSTPKLMKIKKSNGTIIEYDEEKFIKIRTKIQKYKELFQKIIDDLND